MKPLPETRFLNLEYIFNKLLDILGLRDIILAIIRWFGSDSFRIFALIVSVLLLAGIIILLYKIHQLRRKKLGLYAEFLEKKEVPEERGSHWKEIKNKLNSANSSDWKAAIIEVDNLMDEIIMRIGYKGDDLGERLKSIEPSDFDNLQNIWEAHQVRNKIIHEGEKFEVTKDLAKTTLEKYEKALKELRYI